MTGWPWPLDAVQHWFENLWRSINDWITSGLDHLWTVISASFDVVSHWITSGLDALWDSISSGLDTVSTWITSAVDSLWDSVSSAFDTVSTWITEGFDAAWTAISSAFESVATWITEAVDGLWTGITAAFDSVSSWISDAVTSIGDSLTAFFGDIWDKLSRGISDLATDVADWLTLAVGTLAGYVQDAIAAVTGALGDAFRGLLEWMWTQLQAIASAVVGAIGAVRDVVAPTFQAILSGVTGTITDAFAPSTLPKEVQEASDKLAQNVQDSLKRLMPKPGKSLPSFEDVRNSAILTMVAFTGANILGNVAGIAIDLVHPIKPIGVQVAIASIIRSVSENVVTAPLVTIPLEAGVYRPLRYHYNKLNPYLIPGSGDLITFVVREVIELADFVKYMAFQGFDDFFAMAYWEAHWVLPAFGQLREAMWRKIISLEIFGRYVVLHDYKPEPRYPGIPSDQEIMMRLSYELPGRIDARWMFEQGVIETGAHRDLTAQRGMHPDWIDRVTEAEERAAVRAEIEASVRRWAELMREGFLSEGELKDVILETGLGPKITEFWVQRAIAEQLARLLIDEKNAILRAYEGDKITRDEADGQLAAIGVLDVIRERELRISDIKRVGTAA